MKRLEISVLYHFFLTIVLFFSNPSYSQVQNNSAKFDPTKKFTFNIFATYISSAEVQNNLNSSDPIERAAFTDLTGGFGYGFELDYRPSFLNLDLIYYLTSDILILNQKGVIYQYFNGTNIITYSSDEKFTLIPAEFGIKWPLPVGTDNFKIYIGGGAGFYFGNHTRQTNGMTSEMTSMKPGFSLNILAGIDFYIAKNFAVNTELKFREANYDTESKYNSITTLPNPFSTRIIVDGVRVAAGLKYNF